MLEDDSKFGQDQDYDALQVFIKALILQQYPEQAREARENILKFKAEMQLRDELFELKQRKTAIEKQKRLNNSIINLKNEIKNKQINNSIILTRNQKNEFKKICVDKIPINKGFVLEKNTLVNEFNDKKNHGSDEKNLDKNQSLIEIKLLTPDKSSINSAYKRKVTLSDATNNLIDQLRRKKLRSGRNYNWQTTILDSEIGDKVTFTNCFDANSNTIKNEVDQTSNSYWEKQKNVREATEHILSQPSRLKKHSHLFNTDHINNDNNITGEDNHTSEFFLIEKLRKYPLPQNLLQLQECQKMLDKVLTLFKKSNKPAFLSLVGKVMFESSNFTL